VNIGGVVISLVFSLVLIPALMRLLQREHSIAPVTAAALAHP
jgi:multidrug efflux pump subunit AcrB